jgi:hypothetical protein
VIPNSNGRLIAEDQNQGQKRTERQNRTSSSAIYQSTKALNFRREEEEPAEAAVATPAAFPEAIATEFRRPVEFRNFRYHEEIGDGKCEEAHEKHRDAAPNPDLQEKGLASILSVIGRLSLYTRHIA